MLADDSLIFYAPQARSACYDLPPIHEPDVAEMGGMIRQGIFDSTLMDAMRMGKLKVSARSQASGGENEWGLFFHNS